MFRNMCFWQEKEIMIRILKYLLKNSGSMINKLSISYNEIF